MSFLLLAAALTSQDGPTWTERRFAPLAPDAKVRSLVFRDDGQDAAWVLEKDGQVIVATPSGASEAYDDVASVQWAEGYLAYLALKNGVQFAVLGGRKGPEFKNKGKLLHRLVFGLGGRWAYEVDDGDSRGIVLDGKKIESDLPWVGLPFFSRNGQKFGYQAQDAKGVSFMVADGKTGPPFLAVLGGTFDPTGQVLSYTASEKGLWRVIVGDEKGPEYAHASYPTFSPDGKSLIYLARKDASYFIVSRDGEGPPHDHVGPPVFSPDSRTFAYRAGDRGRRFMVHGEKHSSTYDGVGDPVFSPDGTRVAFMALQNRRWRVALMEGPLGDDFDMIGPPIFSNKGMRVAFGVRDREGIAWKVRDAVATAQPAAAATDSAAALFARLLLDRAGPVKLTRVSIETHFDAKSTRASLLLEGQADDSDQVDRFHAGLKGDSAFTDVSPERLLTTGTGRRSFTTRGALRLPSPLPPVEPRGMSPEDSKAVLEILGAEAGKIGVANAMDIAEERGAFALQIRPPVGTKVGATAFLDFLHALERRRPDLRVWKLALALDVDGNLIRDTRTEVTLGLSEARR